MAKREVMLTTADNPYDPFTQYDDWYSFDQSKGYYTSEYLARIAKTSSNLSDEDYNLEVENAINEILKFNLTGNYKKVIKETKVN